MADDDFNFGPLFEPKSQALRQLREHLAQMADQTEVWQAVRALDRRFDKLELLVEGLKELLCKKGIISDKALELAVARIDLQDGLEDGRIGPLAVSLAPPCPGCQRPLNPKRVVCIYCGQGSARPEPKAPEPDVSCVQCAAVVPQRSSWYSESGVICDPCYRAGI